MADNVFLIVMLAVVLIGLFCAGHADSTTPWLKRMALLSPALAALYTLTQMFWGEYEAFWPDILRALTLLAVYWIAARIPHCRKS